MRCRGPASRDNPRRVAREESGRRSAPRLRVTSLVPDASSDLSDASRAGDADRPGAASRSRREVDLGRAQLGMTQGELHLPPNFAPGAKCSPPTTLRRDRPGLGRDGSVQLDGGHLSTVGFSQQAMLPPLVLRAGV